MPLRRDYGDLVSELSSLKMVGEGSVFEREPHVPVTHMGYFKPPAEAFLSELKSRDRRSAKEWEYINAAGVWTELGVAALGVARDQTEDVPSLARKLALAENAMKAALEVLSMRAQYFREITEQGWRLHDRCPSLWSKGMTLCSLNPTAPPGRRLRISWRSRLRRCWPRRVWRRLRATRTLGHRTRGLVISDGERRSWCRRNGKEGSTIVAKDGPQGGRLALGGDEADPIRDIRSAFSALRRGNGTRGDPPVGGRQDVWEG